VCLYVSYQLLPSLDMSCGRMCVRAAGDDVLNWLSFGHTSIPKTLGSEARILAFYYWLTYCILKAGKPKFEAIQSPAAGAGAPAAAANKQEHKETAAGAATGVPAVAVNGAAG